MSEAFIQPATIDGHRLTGSPSEMLKRVEAQMKRITYKPGYRFHVSENYPGRFTLGVTAMVPDSRTPPVPVSWSPTEIATIRVNIVMTFPASMMEDDDKVLWCVRQLCAEAELHERDEWLRFDGKLVHDPHA